MLQSFCTLYYLALETYMYAKQPLINLFFLRRLVRYNSCFQSEKHFELLQVTLRQATRWERWIKLWTTHAVPSCRMLEITQLCSLLSLLGCAEKVGSDLSEQCDKVTSSWEMGQLQNYTCADEPMKNSTKTMHKWEFLRKGDRSRGLLQGEVIICVLWPPHLEWHHLAMLWPICAQAPASACVSACSWGQCLSLWSHIGTLAPVGAQAPSTYRFKKGQCWQQEQSHPQAPKAGR